MGRKPQCDVAECGKRATFGTPPKKASQATKCKPHHDSSKHSNLEKQLQCKIDSCTASANWTADGLTRTTARDKAVLCGEHKPKQPR